MGRSQEDGIEPAVAAETQVQNPGWDNVNEKPVEDDSSGYKQDGVRQVEAITQVWSKRVVVLTFIVVYLIYFVGSMQDSIQRNLSPYVTSAFRKHALLSTISIVSTIIGGVSKLSIAKIVDIWGRIEGFAFMVLLITIGQIMKAVAKNVETYAAAQTLYWVGHLGLLYIVDVVTSDMTSMKNRMIMFGLNNTPTIATVFAGSKIAQLYYDNLNFRWAFGSWAIIMVVTCIPLFVIFIIQSRKAKNFGFYPPPAPKRTIWETVKHYSIELDLMGMLLTSAGFSLILLPFSLADLAPHSWSTGYIIGMLVTGAVCLGLFVAWEKFVAPVQYLPWRFLTDRTILSASLTYGLMFASIYCWDLYYSSYLQVVHSQSITTAGYILNSFSLGSSFLSPFIGLAISYTGNYKYIGMAGIPFTVLGTALLIKFRTPESSVGYLVMCQLFNGFGSGFLSMCANMAVMARVTHQEIAVVLAIYGLFGSIGAAIGETIAGAIWTNILPSKLLEFLPDDAKANATTIYGSLTVQLSYPVGSPVRSAIIQAYDVVMHKMVIAGSIFIIPMTLCVFLWHNGNLKTLENTRGRQTKGNVW